METYIAETIYRIATYNKKNINKNGQLSYVKQAMMVG